MKKFLATVFSLTLLLALCACAAKTPPKDTPASTSNPDVEKTIAYFMELTQIPRPSHHEELISEYLYNWMGEKGFSVVRDEAGNVIADIPATAGCEALPLTALQGHMDMVCVADEGVDFDPLTDPITVINDGTTLTAKGTSLGADNGIGVATIQFIVDPANAVEHGPLRVIITVNEEDGSTGVGALSPQVVADVQYLINVDAEQSDAVVISTAGYIALDVSAAPEMVAPTKAAAYTLGIKGLSGGHSGININAGKINAIIAVADILDSMSEKGIGYELGSFVGGTARNAIPVSAEATIVIDEANIGAAQDCVKAAEKELKATFAATDPMVELSFVAADMPQNVFSTTQQASIVTFAAEVPNGVQSMSAYEDDLVETSSSLGIVEATADKLLFSLYPRGSNQEKLNALAASIEAFASECGFATETLSSEPPWPINENSTLVPLVVDTYHAQTGSDMIVLAIHAGLECGRFAAYNPELDMVSLGPDIADPHTTSETLQIASVGTLLELLQTVLTTV